MSTPWRSFWVFALALVATAAPAAAQADFQFNTTDIPQGGPFNNSSSENVDFADVDGDGDLDAAFADGGDMGNDQSRIWINQGFAQGGTTGVFLDATSTRFPILLRTSRDLDFVDIDNDGDYDVFLSNTSTAMNQSNSWWVNQGGLQGGSPGFFSNDTAARWVNVGVNGPTTHSSVAASLALASGGFIDWSCESVFGDLDGDGDADLVQTSYGSIFCGETPSRLFLNNGESQGGTIGFFEEFNPSDFQLSIHEIQNGDPGLWCEGTFRHDTTNSTGTHCDIADTPLGAELGDLDGDHDVDIIHGARNESPRYYQNRLTETGSFAFRDVTFAKFPPNYATGVGKYEQELGDMDNDDDLDIYGLNWQSLTDVYLKNDGSGSYGAPVSIPGSGSDENEIDWFDYDNDGALDAFISNFSGQDRLYRNTRASGGFGLTNVTATELPVDNTTSLGADCADVDLDGDYDIFVANDMGVANAYLENVNQIADAIAPRVANLEQAPDRTVSTAPTVVRVHVYDNSSWNIAQFDATALEYQVNGGGFSAVPMLFAGGQLFRGEIPGTLVGLIEYHVTSTDEHGNTGASVTKSYISTCNGAIASYCTAKTNSAGCVPSMVGTGSPSASAGSGFFVGADQVLASKVGLLFYSIVGAGGGPFQGGHICATQPVKRTPLQTSSASGSPPCTGTYTFDFNVRVASGVDTTLVAGVQVWSQYWSRDGGVPSGTGLTNGLTFVLCP